MAAGQYAPACHFPADVGAHLAVFGLSAVTFSSGARQALQHSLKAQEFQWATPATTTKELLHRKADTSCYTRSHFSLSKTCIHEKAKGVQTATGEITKRPMEKHSNGERE